MLKTWFKLLVVATMFATGGCAVDRVAVQTTIQNVPIRLELDYGSTRQADSRILAQEFGGPY